MELTRLEILTFLLESYLLDNEGFGDTCSVKAAFKTMLVKMLHQ